MTWDTSLASRAREVTFAGAWKRAQQIKAKIEKLAAGLFQELVTVGIGVMGPPRLGQFTPVWEPLTTAWLERKMNPEFFLNTGALEQELLGKSTSAIFGNPVVQMQVGARTLKVTAAPPPAKYGDVKGPFKLTVIPFPKLTDVWHAEDLVATPGSKTFFKLINPDGKYLRPLVSPFVQWYIHVKIKKAL